MVSESALQSIEQSGRKGLSSQEILAIFAEHGVSMSEATLRKYVQLGLLPRSVRVGEKGKHRGSRGMYPVRVVRQILLIKQMMAADYTIAQIQEEFLFLRGELEELEDALDGIFEKIEARARERSEASPHLSREVKDVKRAGGDLLGRLRAIEERLRTRTVLQVVAG